MIITADQRLASRPKVNIAIFGPSGVGKTYQASTLNPEDTLFLDLEAGTLAIEGWKGDVLPAMNVAKKTGGHPWEVIRGLSCLIGGPDPSDISNPRAEGYGAYSETAYGYYVEGFKKLGLTPEALSKYNLLYVDSITQAARHAFKWSQAQSDAWSDNTDSADTRGAYGLLGREVIQWLTYLQHCSIGVVVVGILERHVDDLERVTYVPQIDGSKIGREIGGIFDVVTTLNWFDFAEHGKQRAFATQQENEWGYPAKDRSGRLAPLEEPNLGKMIEKIQTGERIDKPNFQ